MSIEISQNAYRAIKQPIRNLYARINLLNFEYQIVDELSGVVTGGTINVDANADIRRTCTIDLVVNDGTFEIQAGGKIFLDKYIQIFIGIEIIGKNEIEWINQGIFIIDEPSYTYNATTNTLSFQGLDLMAKLTGLRNGYLEGLPYQIPAGSNIKEVMTALLTQFTSFTKFKIQNNDELDVPYKMDFAAGTTVYQILKELRDLIPSWEIFFDLDGAFVYQPIPSGENEPILITDDIWKDVKIDETVRTDFQSVKNSITVLGRSHDPAHYSNSSVSGSTYQLTIADVTSYSDNMIYGFTANTRVTNPSLQINSLGAYPMYDEGGNRAVIPEAGRYYCVSWQASTNRWLFLGGFQAMATAKETNPESPFYIGNEAGEIQLVLFGGEYDNIYSDYLAQQRAEFEIYQRCRLLDSITLTCVPVYWLDVNILGTYTSRENTESKQYIIKSINTDLSAMGTQTISLMTYYPFYPSV